jgi:hypothetical protein
MRAILCLSVLASLAGCANPQRTPPSTPSSARWRASAGSPCPSRTPTGRHATSTPTSSPSGRPPSSALGRMHLAPLGLGTVLANEEMQKAESPATTAFREATYERLMRACLVNLGYAIAVPPPPSRAFGQYALA